VAKAKGDNMNQALTLRDENEMLREQLRQMREAVIGNEQDMRWRKTLAKYRLGPQQIAVLRVLYRHPGATTELIHQALYGHRPKDYTRHNVGCFIHALRRNLPEPSIVTVHYGYYLTDEFREWLRAALKDNTP
jgi:DNA-binding response OmpR family regulator